MQCFLCFVAECAVSQDASIPTRIFLLPWLLTNITVNKCTAVLRLIYKDSQASWFQKPLRSSWRAHGPILHIINTLIQSKRKWLVAGRKRAASRWSKSNAQRPP